MADSTDVGRRWAVMTGLRGLFMVLAGIYAVLFPAAALLVLTIAGGALILVDGALGLWSLTFGGAKTGNYWFDVIHNVLSIVLGLLILIWPALSTFVAVIFLVYFFAFQAIVVGVMEIVIVIRERQSYARIWPVLLSGILYALFGVLLLFFPLLGAITMTILGGILAVLFGIVLLGMAWRLYQASKAASAAQHIAS
jgi:uncharacterized membrane protein HdeD (DUF308 family)